MSETRRITLSTPMLGYYPYILLEVKPVDDDEEDAVTLSAQAGGPWGDEDGPPRTTADFIEDLREFADMLEEASQ